MAYSEAYGPWKQQYDKSRATVTRTSYEASARRRTRPSPAPLHPCRMSAPPASLLAVCPAPPSCVSNLTYAAHCADSTVPPVCQTSRRGARCVPGPAGRLWHHLCQAGGPGSKVRQGCLPLPHQGKLLSCSEKRQGIGHGAPLFGAARGCKGPPETQGESAGMGVSRRGQHRRCAGGPAACPAGRGQRLQPSALCTPLPPHCTLSASRPCRQWCLTSTEVLGQPGPGRPASRCWPARRGSKAGLPPWHVT